MPEKPCNLVPVPRRVLESHAERLHSSLHEALEATQQRKAELEAELDRVIRERDEALREANALREQQRQAAEALRGNLFDQ